MTLKRWKITIEYDGGPFSGWQRQRHVLSVQQVIEDAIAKFCQQDIVIYAAGRTDAGVHATGQVAHFDLNYGERQLDDYTLLKAINANIGEHPVSIVCCTEISPDFHARFDAKHKIYRYYILNRPAPPTFQHGQVWHIKKPLDAAAMHNAAQILTGYHDFTTFRDSQCQAKSPLRTLSRLDISRKDDMITIEAEAKSFLHHQIRNFAGALANVGNGKWSPTDLQAALDAKDRTRGGITAPAEGLFLCHVDY